MSAPLAGKFQDHYAVLDIDPSSKSDVIQKAYSKLAQKHRPGGPFPDPEVFAAVNHAYEILTDPQLRADYDKIKGIGAETGPPKFSGPVFFESLGRDADLRVALLCILYDRRRTKPFTPSISIRNLEAMLDCTNDELNLTLWYLKQKGLAVMDDKSSLQIAVKGMDLLEATRPTPEQVMPMLRQPTQGAREIAIGDAAGSKSDASGLDNLLNATTDEVDGSDDGGEFVDEEYATDEYAEDLLQAESEYSSDYQEDASTLGEQEEWDEVAVAPTPARAAQPAVVEWTFSTATKR